MNPKHTRARDERREGAGLITDRRKRLGHKNVEALCGYFRGVIGSFGLITLQEERWLVIFLSSA